MTPRILWIASLAACCVAANAPAQPHGARRELIVCGWDEVFILDLEAKTDPVDAGTGRSTSRVWTWRAQDRSDLPDEFKPLFKTTDECRPYDDGGRILITSSGGGVALVNRADGRVLFHDDGSPQYAFTGKPSRMPHATPAIRLASRDARRRVP